MFRIIVFNLTNEKIGMHFALIGKGHVFVGNSSMKNMHRFTTDLCPEIKLFLLYYRPVC